MSLASFIHDPTTIKSNEETYSSILSSNSEAVTVDIPKTRNRNLCLANRSHLSSFENNFGENDEILYDGHNSTNYLASNGYSIYVLSLSENECYLIFYFVLLMCLTTLRWLYNILAIIFSVGNGFISAEFEDDSA